jgi:hypothetical protein
MPPSPSTLNTRQRSYHPLLKRGQFPLTPFYGRERQCVTPIDPRPQRGLSQGLPTSAVLPLRLRCYERKPGALITQQSPEPHLVQQDLLVSCFPERAYLLGFTPDRKGLLLYAQRDELFEMLGFGITAARLPLRHRAPGD